MALQILTDQQANHEQTAENAEATSASHSFSSTTGATEAGPAVSAPSAEHDVGLEGETQERHVVAAGTNAVPNGTAMVGENAEAVAANPPAAPGYVALKSPSSAGVPGVNGLLIGGKEDQEPSGGALQSSSKTILGETLTVSSGERRDSLSSTCDDTPHSRIGNGSTFSWSSSSASASSFSSDCHTSLNSPLFSAGPGLVSDCFQSSIKSRSTSNSSGSSSTGTSGTLSDSTSTGGNNKADGCESISKYVSRSSDESHFGSSRYCILATSSTTNSSSSSIESAATTSGGSSSCCESTRISVDSMLLGFETNNTTSESSGSSFEESSTKENRTGAVKRSQQHLGEELRETASVLPHDMSSFEDFSKSVKGNERGSSPDAGKNCRETIAEVSYSPDVCGITQHTPHSNNSITFNSISNSRRRSSSCSAGSKEEKGRSRLIRGRLRLAHSDLPKGGEHQLQENDHRDERLAIEFPGVFNGLDAERGKASETLSPRSSNAGVGVSGSPRVFAADSQAKSECSSSSATADDVLTEEIEYTSKKSCLGLERSAWSDKKQLSSGGVTETTPDPLSHNCYSSTRLQGTAATAALAVTAEDVRLSAGSSAPVRRSSPRHGSAPGGSNRSRTPSLVGVRKGVQQQQASRSSNISCSSVSELVVQRSPGRADTESTTACGADHKSKREGGGGAGRGGGQTEGSANGAKESAVCKREDRWTSPFPGVKYCRSRNAWIARWSESGQEKWKTFPVKDSSFEEARRRALEFRQEKDRRKFERLWQQLNAEGLAAGNNAEGRSSRLSPGGGKLSGSDSSSGEGGASQKQAVGGRATAGRNTHLSKDSKGTSAWQQQEEGRTSELPGTPRLTRLSAYRSNLLLNSTQRQQQQRKKKDGQQQQQLEEMIRQQGVSCDDSRRGSLSKSTTNTDRSAGGEGIDVSGSGRLWLTPCVYSDTTASSGCGKDEEPLSPVYRSSGWPHINGVTNIYVQGGPGSSTFPTTSPNSLVSPEAGWLSVEDPVRREPSGPLKAAAPTSGREEADNTGGKNEVHRQQQQQSVANGLTSTSPTVSIEGHDGLAGGRVVEALLRVLNGESADAMRKQGLCPGKIALLLGERGLLPADAIARLPAEEMPVCRKRRSRDEGTMYAGGESTTAESVSPTSMKILSMYKAALLLIMDDLMSNGLPLFIASGGGTALGTDYRHLSQVSALAEGKVQLGDRKALIEHSMRKMLEEQRKCIAEASLLGAVSPFVKLFETCILDQKLPSQADDTGRMQLVYLNALSALQELSLSVKTGNSVVW